MGGATVLDAEDRRANRKPWEPDVAMVSLRGDVFDPAEAPASTRAVTVAGYAELLGTLPPAWTVKIETRVGMQVLAFRNGGADMGCWEPETGDLLLTGRGWKAMRHASGDDIPTYKR